MVMKYKRMPIEIESPEQMGYDKIKFNLTESSFSDQNLSDLEIDLSGLLISYGDHVGIPELRKLVIQDSPKLNIDQVLMTTGAASALFMIATSLLEKGDEIVVMKPNYATNLETPRAIGCVVKEWDLSFEEGFVPNMDRLQSLVTDRTKIISLTTPHNPTGKIISQKQILEVVQIAKRVGAKVLVDETYRDMSYESLEPLAATLSSEVISVSSLSKTYGLPGIRMGWVVCQDPKLMQTLLAAKEQMFICNSIVDETIALKYLKDRTRRLNQVMTDIRRRFEITKSWMSSQDDFIWVQPEGGVVAFPKLQSVPNDKIDRYYQILNNEFGTYVGPGHWFEQSRNFMRLGFGWPEDHLLTEGLKNLNKAVKKVLS